MPAPSSEDLVERIRKFVAHHIGVRPEKIKTETDVIKDIWGADVWELIEEFGKEFQVNLDTFRPDEHTGPEGIGCVFFPFDDSWETKKFIPIRLRDLVESAQRGVWCINYPIHKWPPSPREGK